MKRTESQKTLLIGLDGATFDIIDPLLKEGKLPHIGRLLKNGTSAHLRSTIMPNSYPAWTSCLTGVNPGKHGIFWSLIREGKTAYPLRLMTTLDLGAKPLWQLLGEKGMKVGVINVPIVYPPVEVNGFLVSGALTPSDASVFTHPQNLKTDILKAVPEYRCEIEFGEMDLKKLSAHILKSIEHRERLIVHLMKNQPWDFFFAVFTESDLAQHKYWSGIDSRHRGYLRAKKNFGAFVHEVYSRLDRSLGNILSSLTENTRIILLSDHGFGPLHQTFSVYKWLVENKYMRLKESFLRRSAKSALQHIPAMDLIKAKIQSLRTRAELTEDKKSVRSMKEKDALAGIDLIQRIDWNSTRAYFTPDNGIRLNLIGREPSGIVAPGQEADLLTEEIKTGLSRLCYSNGEPVFEAVKAKEEVFSGPFVDRAPDLVIPINHSSAPPEPESWKFTILPQNLNGAHTPNGIFVAQGDGIKKDHRMPAASIMDIAPTVLFMYGEPVTEDMDGQVLLNMFESRFLEKNKLVKHGSSFNPDIKPTDFIAIETSEVKKRLKSLGYID